MHLTIYNVVTDPHKVKIFYSGIFPSSKVLLNFCISNSIPFEPNRIDYLYGDFKEEPILQDKDISISGRYKRNFLEFSLSFFFLVNR